MITTNNPAYIGEMKEAYLMNGGTWNKEGNLLGVRNEYAKPNRWGCVLGIGSDKKLMLCMGTTRPGKPATEKKKGGAEWLGLGYHVDIWKRPEFGQKFGMEVFKQSGKISGFLDANRNYIHDPSDPLFQDVGPEAGAWGHSTHKTDLSFINNSSWLCQVWKFYREFNSIVKEAKISDQKFFSYMLFGLKTETQKFYDMVYPS